MSSIVTFRINGYDNSINKDSVEFFLKIVDDDDKVLCNFSIRDDGIYYYRPRSSILSPTESDQSRATDNGFLSMENLKDLFETMAAADLDPRKKLLEIKTNKNKLEIKGGAATDDH